MTDIAIILASGDTLFNVGKSYKWQAVVNANCYINSISGSPAVLLRRIAGITDICMNQTSLLSSISFQGEVKSIIKAILTNGVTELTGIKDNIILGKLPLIGTAVYERSIENTIDNYN